MVLTFDTSFEFDFSPCLNNLIKRLCDIATLTYAKCKKKVSNNFRDYNLVCNI